MFQVSIHDIEDILRDYGVLSKPVSFTELQRYNYEKNDAKSKEVRLIINQTGCLLSCVLKMNTM